MNQLRIAIFLHKKDIFILLFLMLLLLLAKSASGESISQTTNAKLCELSANMAIKANKSYGDGIVHCNRAIQHDKLSKYDLAGTYVNRGVLYMSMNRKKSAVISYRRAQKIGGDTSTLHINFGNIALLNGDERKAIGYYDKALAVSDGSTHVAYFNRGIANERLGKWMNAAHDYQEAINRNSEFSAAINRLKRLEERMRIVSMGNAF